MSLLPQEDEKFTLSKDNHLRFLNITRSYKRDNLDKKIRLFGEDGFKDDGFKLTPELDAYRLIAGYNEGSFGALSMLINPEVVNRADHLGLLELSSVIIPLAIISEMVNHFFYERSLLNNGSIVHGSNSIFKDLFDKNYKNPGIQFAFTALWSLYQVIRVPVISLAILTALVLWIPKMVIGALASSLVLITRPLWYPVASYINQKSLEIKHKTDDKLPGLDGDVDEGERLLQDDSQQPQPGSKPKTQLKTSNINGEDSTAIAIEDGGKPLDNSFSG